MCAMQNIDDVRELHWTENRQRDRAAVVLVARIEFLYEINLHPRARRKFDLQHDRFACQGIHRACGHISQAGSSCVGVGFKWFGGEKAVVAAAWFYRSGFVNLPASVAIRAVVEVDFLVRLIEVQTAFQAGELG
jgi:hypothetical protein